MEADAYIPIPELRASINCPKKIPYSAFLPKSKTDARAIPSAKNIDTVTIEFSKDR
jgi:hypothetical protein